MDKKVAAGVCAAAMLLVVLASSALMTNWEEYGMGESPGSIDFIGALDGDGNPILDEDGRYASLNFALFEGYGPLMLILALLMFGAMIGGVCIAREEVDSDDTY
ncbi:MAG: hypothetical protein FWH47_03165 [Methanomassiliicoccaceae archaeon]|nr:hypothetical protein [Methanomassiliicoccaceae archaeon]